jgi:ribosomal-protein-alanine N-acetyltransferase
MKISPVKLKDLNNIVKLEKKIFRKNAFSKKLLKKLILTNLVFLKLEIGGIKKDLIGFIIILKDKYNRANLINLLIDSKHHRNGFGTFLLKDGLIRLKRKSKRIKKIILNVNVENLPAIRLYEKFNFKIIERIEHYYYTDEDAYLMELDLRKNDYLN